MPKGKKGPTPNIDPQKVDETVPVETDEQQAQTEASAEAVDDTEVQAPPPMTPEKIYWYACQQCSFRSDYEIESDEHMVGTDHEVELVEKEAEQAELFSGPDTVIRQLRGHMSSGRIGELQGKLAELCDQKIEQQDTMKMARERVKGLEAEIAEIVATLRDPFELMAVPCKWQISESGNEKTLIRLDTNEVLETKALSMEDRQAEAERVLSGNQQEQQQPAEEPVAVHG